MNATTKTETAAQHRTTRRAGRVAMALAAALISACAKAPGAAPAPRPSGATAAPPAGICGLLTLREVRASMPAADRAVESNDLAAQGVARCEWRGGPKDSIVLELSRWTSGGESAHAELEPLADGLVDPQLPDAATTALMQTLTGVGDEAVAFAERRDEGRGVLSSAAVLIVKKGDQVLLMNAADLSGGERSKVLQQLATLAKAATARL